MAERWTAAEFAEFCVALLGSAYGWQTRIADRLGVDPRTVRRWAAGHIAVPAGVQADLEEAARLKVGERMGFPCRDEWIVGDGPPGPGGARREYVVHTAPPRFVGRVVALDELTGEPEPDEEPVDTETGVAYAGGPDCLICEVEWIDPIPRGPEVAQLMEAAADAIDAATFDGA